MFITLAKNDGITILVCNGGKKEVNLSKGKNIIHL